jgi:hypothetical protein
VVRNSRLNGFVQSAAGIAGKLTRVPIAERVLFVTTLDEALTKLGDDRDKNTDVREANPYGDA